MNYTPAIYARSLLEVHREKNLSKSAVARFMMIVRRNNHTAWIPQIITRFEDLMYRSKGITRVEVIAARNDLKKMLPKVRRAFGRKAEVQFSLKPDIIGGVIFNINRDVIIDASAKTAIERMFTHS